MNTTKILDLAQLAHIQPTRTQQTRQSALTGRIDQARQIRQTRVDLFRGVEKPWVGRSVRDGS